MGVFGCASTAVVEFEPDHAVGKRILLVDDQPDVRATIRLLLDMDDHRIVEAKDATEALERFQSDLFDLVVTDHAMPGMTGNELAATIKQLVPGQPVLMITGSVEKLRGCRICADSVLNKPFSFSELRHAVTQLC